MKENFHKPHVAILFTQKKVTENFQHLVPFRNYYLGQHRQRKENKGENEEEEHFSLSNERKKINKIC